MSTKSGQHPSVGFAALAAEPPAVRPRKGASAVRAALKQIVLVGVLFLLSGWCLLSSFSIGMLGAYNDPSVYRHSAAFMIAAAVIGIVAIWRLIVLFRRHGRENLL